MTVISHFPAHVILKEKRHFVYIMETLLAKERVSQQAGARAARRGYTTTSHADSSIAVALKAGRPVWK